MLIYTDTTSEDIDYDTHPPDFSFEPTTLDSTRNVKIKYKGKESKIMVVVDNPIIKAVDYFTIKSNIVKAEYSS